MTDLVLPAGIRLDPASIVDGPQCSSSGAFCFLCQFEGDADGNDLYSSMLNQIDHLACQKRELSIVRTVHKSTTKLSETQWRTNIRLKENICEPDWSMESIRRHLVFDTV